MAKVQVIIAKAGEDMYRAEIEDTLESYQSLVNGRIGGVHLTDNLFLYCNDEHKLVDDPFEKINFLFMHNDEVVDFIGDDVVIVSIDEEGDTQDLSMNDCMYILENVTEEYFNVDGDIKKVKVISV